jgi:hypothetical protein
VTLLEQAIEMTACPLLKKPSVSQNKTAIAQEQDSAGKEHTLRP